MDSVSVSVSGDDDGDARRERTRSYSTLNTLHHETRQEVELLHKQLLLKDNIVADLKARLGRHERLCVALGDGEPLLLGPSKSLVESLCEEICKLKQRRNETEFKASRQAEEIQRLTMQLREKELELESVRCQPEHEKDQEIRRLRASLEERERTEATRAVLCSSLAEEADQLRGQLGATVKVCQELLARLETEAVGGEAAAAEVAAAEQQQKAKEVQMTESSGRSEMNAQICQLQEENQQLKQRVVYVQGLNSQWQKYDSSREEYIRVLCQRLKESAAPALVPALGSVSTGLLHHEISRLNGLLEEKMSECARLGREADDGKRRDRERIQTLQQQVLIYAEDFKSERADRERAQGQIQDLKEQLYQLKLHKQQGAGRENRDLVPMCRVHIGHRISSRRHRESADHLLRTSSETQQQQQQQQHQPAVAAAAATAAADCPGLSELQCPRCLATFSETDATEYLNHCQDCATL